MRILIALFVFVLLWSFAVISDAQTSDGVTPASESICDGEVGAAYGLCNAYCEAMDCDSEEPNASEKACEKVLANYVKHTDMMPPCEGFSFEGCNDDCEAVYDECLLTNSQSVCCLERRSCYEECCEIRNDIFVTQCIEDNCEAGDQACIQECERLGQQTCQSPACIIIPPFPR